MDEYLEKLKEEYAELCIRCYKLERFLDKIRTEEVGSSNLKCPKPFLEKQLSAMREYKEMLGKRIDYYFLKLEIEGDEE